MVKVTEKQIIRMIVYRESGLTYWQIMKKMGPDFYPQLVNYYILNYKLTGGTKIEKI
jgi:hypothetical protein